MTPEQKAHIRALGALAIREHYHCYDPWYSCPLAEGGCANDAYDKDKCNCAADKHNTSVQTLLRKLLKE